MLTYNSNHGTAGDSVAGGSSFSLGGMTFVSDPANPLSGTGTGLIYQGAPEVAVQLSGAACNEQTKLADSLLWLRYFPVVSLEIGYRF